MTSVIDGLNELLRRERGEVEAVAELIREIKETDPDIATSARDVLETAGWSCQGLYHRIEWLGGTPTMDTEDHSEDLQDQPNTKAKIQFLCRSQEQDLELTQSLLDKPILDRDTRDLLQRLHTAHEDALHWCKAALAEWEIAR